MIKSSKPILFPILEKTVHINYTLTRVTLFTPYFIMIQIWLQGLM